MANPEDLASSPLISVITPAFNAERTIARTLASVAAQTFSDWEVVVVDDGSTDGTAERVRRFADGEARVRLIRQPNRGASAARNIGAEAAHGKWLLFMDADDTARRTHMSHLARRARARPEAAVICCDAVRLDEKGLPIGSMRARQLDRDPIGASARWTPLAIHAAILLRRTFETVGGFDTTLATHEDWDLWLRIARSGAKYASVRRRLAHYRSTAGSLTRNSAAMSRDYATVLRRGQAPDPRLPAGGLPTPKIDLDERLVLAGLWNACAALGARAGVAAALNCLPAPFTLPWSLAEAGGAMVDGWAVGAARGSWELAATWTEVEAVLLPFLESLEDPRAAYALLKAFEREAVRVGRFGARATLHRTVGVSWGLVPLLFGVRTADRIDEIVLRVPVMRPRSRFIMQAPIWGGRMSGRAARMLTVRWLGALIRRMAADRPWVAAAIVRRRLAMAIRTVIGRPSSKASAPIMLERRAAPRAIANASPHALRIMAEVREAAAEISRVALPYSAAAPEPIGPHPEKRAAWNAFFESHPDPWGYTSDYEQIKYDRTVAMVPDGVGSALELGAAEGRFTLRLAELCTHVRALDLSSTALSRARDRCSGRDNIDYVVSDFFNEPIEGSWDLITCAEVLYYLPDRAALTPVLEKMRDALNPGGWLIQAHAFELADDPTRTGMDWSAPFGGRMINETLERIGGLEHVRSLRTELYSIDLYRRSGGATASPRLEVEAAPLGCELEPQVSRNVVWNGALKTRKELQSSTALAVPVLMYHRVSDSGPEELAPYRISPAVLDQQLRFLRRRGYRSISPAEWGRAVSRLSLPAGRPIMLTFDDAYEDFFDIAWPIIEANGFSAHVFVPVDKVGGCADWDADAGEPARLMSWDQIEAIAEGVTFGSHLGRHLRSDTLDSDELLREAVWSRAVLERHLGEPVTTVAPPYGIMDDRCRGVFRTAGFTRVFGVESGMARTFGPPLDTPRLEVFGDQSLDAFADMLGRGQDEPPQGADVRPLEHP